eukprot:761032-Hanusia_phi.AAC.1
MPPSDDYRVLSLAVPRCQRPRPHSSEPWSEFPAAAAAEGPAAVRSAPDLPIKRPHRGTSEVPGSDRGTWNFLALPGGARRARAGPRTRELPGNSAGQLETCGKARPAPESLSRMYHSI